MSSKARKVKKQNSEVKSTLVPRLRFPEFRSSGEWDTCALSNFVTSLDAGVSVNSGDRPARSSESGILKTSCVTNGIFDPSENKVVLDPAELKRLREPVCANTIIISRMNTPALVGANAYIKTDLDNIFLPDRLWAAKSASGACIQFVAYILGSGDGRAALSELATGTSGSMKNITKSDVLGIRISAPDYPEQKKIADCLSSLDELIDVENRKQNVLQSYKEGLLEQLLPGKGETLPRLRYPEFLDAGSWVSKTLGELLKRNPDYGLNAAGVPYSSSLPIFLRITDISDDGSILTSGRVSVDAVPQEQYFLEPGDIVLARTGASVGKTYKYREDDGPLVFAGFLIRIKPVPGKVVPLGAWDRAIQNDG
jgi:type I restriction enzyme S subunit